MDITQVINHVGRSVQKHRILYSPGLSRGHLVYDVRRSSHSSQIYIKSPSPILSPTLTLTLHPSSTHQPNLRIPTHIIPNPIIIQQPLDTPHRTNRHILIPQLHPREIHHVLLRDGADDALDLLGAHTATSRHDLPADVLGHGGGAVEREQDGGFELGFGALGLGFGDVVGKARPFAQREVDEVVNLRFVFGDEVDAPEAVGWDGLVSLLFPLHG